ncbi:MAG: hypothetical protein AAB368_15675, partial [bacterium]
FNGASLALNQEYNPATDTWAAKASMPTARQALATAVVDGRLFALGGSNGSSLRVDQQYDPATDTWVTKAAMPTARYGLVAATVNRRFYAIGGIGAGPLGTAEEGFPGMSPGATFTFTITGQVGSVCAATPVSNTGWVSVASSCASQNTITNATGFTLPAQGPLAPLGLTARGQNEQMYLNWAPAVPTCNPVASYSVYRAFCEGCVYSAIATVTGTTYTDPGLVNGTPVWYKVLATDVLANPGAFSATATGTPLDSAINPPGCLAAVQRGTSNVVDLSWCLIVPGTHPATAYAVYRTTMAFPSIAGGPIAVVGPSTSMFTDYLPTTGTFWYHARALGSLSDPSPLSAPPITNTNNPPTRPLELVAEARTGKIVLNWNASDQGPAISFPVAGYYIYRHLGGPVAPGDPVYATVIGQYPATYSDFGIGTGVEYHYTVNAFDSAGPANESGASNDAAAICQPLGLAIAKDQ